MEKIEGGQFYMKSEPRCPVHGQMRMRLACDPAADAAVVVEAWTCAGFDGEGCGYVLLNTDVPWTYIGEADSIKFTLLDVPLLLETPT